MRRARPLIGLALSTLLLGACDEQGVGGGSTIGAKAGNVDFVRSASRDVERRGVSRTERRDRTSRRFGRGSTELLPHLGDYVVHESGFATARFKSAQGELTINIENDCGDWTLQETWDLRLTDQAGQSHRSNLIYRISEIASVDRVKFAYSRHHLGEDTDFIGDVLPIDGGFLASFTEPRIADLVLEPEIVFPVTHLRQVLAAARRQQGDFETLVFDGGNRFPYRAVATIGRDRRQDDRNPRVVAARTELDDQTSDRLPRGRHWPVRVDYFPPDDAYAPAIFTREFLLHESGIVLAFHFDYGDVQLDARLKTLDIHDEPDCPE